MQLEDFYDYKNQLMGDLLTNEKIVALIQDDGKPLKDVSDLMYTQVFPYEYMPDTVTDAHTFICCDVDVQRSLNKTFLMPVIYIWVFAHRSKLRLPDGGGVRVDRIMSEIAKTINGSRMYGLGELDLYSVKRYAPNNEFTGKVMMLQAKEFNRVLPTGKPIPSNRKAGV